MVGIPLQLLGDVVVRLLHNLLHDANIMFGVLAEFRGLTNEDSTSIAGGSDKFLSEFVQGRDTAGQVVETTSNRAVGTTFLVQEINERLFVTTTIVSNRIRLVVLALSEELDGGIGRDTVHLSDRLVVTRISIHVGDDTVRLGLEVARDFLVDWFQRFAVSAPRSSESDENVLGVV